MANTNRMSLGQAICGQVRFRDVTARAKGLKWRRSNGIDWCWGQKLTLWCRWSTRTSISSASRVRSCRLFLIRGDCVCCQWGPRKGRRAGAVSQFARVKVLEPTTKKGFTCEIPVQPLFSIVLRTLVLLHCPPPRATLAAALGPSTHDAYGPLQL